MDTYASVKLSEEQLSRSQTLRNGFSYLHTLVLQSTKPSREQSLVLTNLEQASMWLNKAISRE